jgi:hypothetical protein
MKTCNACALTILFGGVRAEGFRFCSKKCAATSPWLSAIRAVPQDQVDAQATAIFKGACPICGGPGPVDVRPAYRIYSVVVITITNHTTAICCAKCGRKEQLSALGLSAAFGWWGIPAGVVGTPYLIGANLLAMSRNKRTTPSKELKQHVRQAIAAQPSTEGFAPYTRGLSSV